MKTLLATLALVLSSACIAQERGLISLQAESFAGGPMYRWEITEKRNLAQQRWVPIQGNPPLPVNKAAEVAVGWLKKRHPDVKEFAVSNVQLSPVGFGQPPADRWFYRVEFNPVVAGRVLHGGRFVAVVLFDGSVVEPRAEATSSAR